MSARPERGEQGGGAVALIVVGHGAETAFLHGQAWLGSIQRLDLTFLVDRQDDGVGGRIGIKPSDIAQFADEVRIVRELGLPVALWLQAVGTPDRRTDPGTYPHPCRSVRMNSARHVTVDEL